MSPSWMIRNPRVAMTVNSSLVAFGQAEPSLKIEIVLDLLELSRAEKRPARKLIINLAMCWRIGSSFRSNRSINSLNFFWRSSQLSPPGSRVAATFSMSLTYSWIDSCSAWTCSNPRSMQPASRPSCFSANPLFSRPSSVGSTRQPPSKPVRSGSLCGRRCLMLLLTCLFENPMSRRMVAEYARLHLLMPTTAGAGCFPPAIAPRAWQSLPHALAQLGRCRYLAQQREQRIHLDQLADCHHLPLHVVEQLLVGNLLRLTCLVRRQVGAMTCSALYISRQNDI